MAASRFRRFLLALAGTATVAAAMPASALSIRLIDKGGVAGSPALLGFQIAAKYWESVLTSDATVNFNVGFQPLAPRILGQTGSSLYTYLPITTYQALLAGASSGNGVDTAAVAALPATDSTGSIAVTVPAYADPSTRDGVAATGSRIAPLDTAITATMAVSSANVKALIGDPTFQGDQIDGSITFSSNYAFDFDPSDGITAGSYDFVGVAVHEMGHALGFLSAADDFDYSVGPGDVDSAWWGYALDMFRYTAPGQLDWTFGTNSYFSLDGGVTPFLGSYFSTGANHGDTWQASHWKSPGGCTGFIGIMNPYLCDGQNDAVTAQDIGLFDAIGWNSNVDATTDPTYSFSTARMYTSFIGEIPEPATWAQMLIGFGLIGAAARRRPKAQPLRARA